MRIKRMGRKQMVGGNYAGLTGCGKGKRKGVGGMI